MDVAHRERRTDRPEVIVLDVNETLSDLSGLRPAFEAVGLRPDEVEAWFAGVLRDAFALSMTGAVPAFGQVATASLQARLAGRGLSPDGAQQVMGALMALTPHPDVVPGLTRLAAAGSRIVTLSNGSAEVARTLLSHTPADAVIEAYLSVEDAGVWKPAPGAYGYALQATGVPPADAMLVAVHPWDVAGAHRAGLRTAWVRRGDERYPAHFERADVEVGSFVELAELLA